MFLFATHKAKIGKEVEKVAFLSAFSLLAQRTGKVFSLNFVFILQANPVAPAAG